MNAARQNGQICTQAASPRIRISSTPSADGIRTGCSDEGRRSRGTVTGLSTVRSMKVVEIRRYPIKSLLGERPATAEVDRRGLVGDRLWAVRDEDGKLGSGKNTRRFRRMPGLFRLRGHSSDDPRSASGDDPRGHSSDDPRSASGDGPRSHSSDGVPVVELPDGRRFAADDPAGHRAVSDVLGRRVTIAREAAVVHHDEGPVSLISTAGLRHLAHLTGAPVDPLRFRANLLVDVPGHGFPEEDWLGRDLRIGDRVVLRPRRRLTRCVMIDLAQEDAPEHGRLLRTVAEHHDLTFGVWATVERAGRIALHDPVVPGPGG